MTALSPLACILPMICENNTWILGDGEKMKAFRIITILIIPLLLLCIMQRADAQGLRSTAYGDVNSNGKVGTDDVVLVLRYCIGLTPFYFEQFMSGDVNCDGMVDVSDVNAIINYILKLYPGDPFVFDAGDLDDKRPCSTTLLRRFQFV